jgi:hypothetical protein
MAAYGLVGTKNLHAVPPFAYQRAMNVVVDAGLMAREGGSALYTPSPISGAPKVQALLDWWPDAATQRLLAATNDGKLLRDTGDGSFATTLKGGLSTSGLPVWCEGGAESFGNARKAFHTNGVNVVQVLAADGVTTADLATPPADWSGANQPRSLFLHRNRLWGILAHRVYGSLTTNHEDFTTAGVLQFAVFPGVAQFLQGGISFKEFLFLWKWPRGIAFLDDTDTNSTNWFMKLLTDAVGLAGPKALCAVDDDVLFLSEIAHLHLVSHVRQNDIQASDLTAANELSEWVRENLNLNATALASATAIYYPDRKQAMVAVPGAGATTNTLKLIVDFNGKAPKITVSNKDVCDGLTLRRDSNGIQRPISGDAVGQVWKLDQVAPTKNGVAYTSDFQTVETDFAWADPGLASVRKNLAWLELVMRPTGIAGEALFVDIYLDGTFTQTLTYTLTGGVLLGQFLLGTDVLGGETTLRIRKRMRGSCYRWSAKVRHASLTQDPRVSELVVGFGAGGLRPHG